MATRIAIETKGETISTRGWLVGFTLPILMSQGAILNETVKGDRHETIGYRKTIAQVMDEGEHTPIYIWGPPGVGKSSIVKQVAVERGIGFKDVRMTLLDPTDLRGIPVPKDGLAQWLAPSFLPDKARDGEQGILFLDELNAAPPLVQASGYQLVLDRRIGEYELPEGWSIVAAGNRQGDRAVTHRMSSALADRFVHLNYDVDLADWTEWAIHREDISDASTQRIAPMVLGFIQFRPAMLFAFRPDKR